MDKLLISLTVPSLEESFDLFVPDDLPVRQVTQLFAEALTELSGGEYVSSGSELLCRTDPCQLLEPKRSLREHGIQNGDRLMIF